MRYAPGVTSAVYLESVNEGKIRDVNGNTVGEWRVSGDV